MLQMQIAKLESEKEACKCASRLEAQINQVANTAAMGIQQNANGLACLPAEHRQRALQDRGAHRRRLPDSHAQVQQLDGSYYGRCARGVVPA